AIDLAVEADQAVRPSRAAHLLWRKGRGQSPWGAKGFGQALVKAEDAAQWPRQTVFRLGRGQPAPGPKPGQNRGPAGDKAATGKPSQFLLGRGARGRSHRIRIIHTQAPSLAPTHSPRPSRGSCSTLPERPGQCGRQRTARSRSSG